MRTTIMLPPELMRAAKARSAEQGESLKALLRRALEAELARSESAAPRHARVTLPMFGTTGTPPVRLSNADLARALADADAARVPAPRRRRSGSRWKRPSR
jgi:hypothetical protein